MSNLMNPRLWQRQPGESPADAGFGRDGLADSDATHSALATHAGSAGAAAGAQPVQVGAVPRPAEQAQTVFRGLVSLLVTSEGLTAL